MNDIAAEVRDIIVLHLGVAEAQITDELISGNQFRPEFLNRFDEIVIFRPLNKEELLQVIDHLAFRNMDERLVFYLRRDQEKFGTDVIAQDTQQ